MSGVNISGSLVESDATWRDRNDPTTTDSQNGQQTISAIDGRGRERISALVAPPPRPALLMQYLPAPTTLSAATAEGAATTATAGESPGVVAVLKTWVRLPEIDL